ncbi:hypothetical protein A0H81_09425 [Grifola frondosa]|uniref:Ribonuclease H1 N-terminal domain-containing protein n=1 Tax=Grifola frondosa TaxID=5627 RepID=A0A1C7M1B6_GRIFR|nr:hypothetical protein A0H81_09425 [Grifola frondosa]
MPSLPEDLRFSDLTHPNVHPSDPRLLAQGKRIKGPNAKYYVIWRGRRTGIFGNWALARALVRGYPQAAFAGYQSEADARRAFVEGPTSEELHLVNRPGSFDEFEDDQIEPGDIAFCNRIVSISLFSPRPTGRRVPTHTHPPIHAFLHLRSPPPLSVSHVSLRRRVNIIQIAPIRSFDSGM